MAPTMNTILLAAAALVARQAMAQSSVVSLILPDVKSQAIVASVVSADASATVYSLACPSGQKSGTGMCGLLPSMLVKQGPSTLELHMTIPSTYSVDASCQITADAARCTETVMEANDDNPGLDPSVISTVDSLTGLSTLMLPVTVTAGLEKLSGGSGGAGGSSSATTTPATPAASTTSGAKSTSTSASSTSSASSSSGLSGSTNGTASSSSSSGSGSSTTAPTSTSSGAQGLATTSMSTSTTAAPINGIGGTGSNSTTSAISTAGVAPVQRDFALAGAALFAAGAALLL